MWYIAAQPDSGEVPMFPGLVSWTPPGCCALSSPLPRQTHVLVGDRDCCVRGKGDCRMGNDMGRGLAGLWPIGCLLMFALFFSD